MHTFRPFIRLLLNAALAGVSLLAGTHAATRADILTILLAAARTGICAAFRTGSCAAIRTGLQACEKAMGIRCTR